MKKIIISILFYIFAFSLFYNIYGYTVDDVRDLLGMERLDSIYTQEEIKTIINQYNNIEAVNIELRLRELQRDVSSFRSNEEEYNKLLKELENKNNNLSAAFQGGKNVVDVLKAKSSLETTLQKIDSFNLIGGLEINVELLPNDWEEKYFEVQEILQTLGKQYDIGDVGNAMFCPLILNFNLTSLYGMRLDPVDEEIIRLHNGIDLQADIGTSVHSQWNGVVSRIYETESGGLSLEISHGPGLRTQYLHLSEILVEVGQVVEQYEKVALTGNSGRTTGPHLHFSVLVDDEYVNPMYLYGDRGLRALQSYISTTTGHYSAMAEIMENLKEKPTEKSFEMEENLFQKALDSGFVPFDRSKMFE